MNKKIKNAGTVFIISFMILFGNFIAPQLHNSYLRYEVGESAVKVLVAEGSGGSGFAIKSASGQHFIATNKHVCDAATNSWVKIQSNDKKIDAWKKVIYIDKKADICLVEGDARLAPLKLASQPEQGELHYIVGYPGLRPLTVSTGEFVGFDTVQVADESAVKKNQCYGEIYTLSPMEQFFYGREWICIKTYRSYSSSAVAYGGNSGSPVVNKYGNVIGILFAGPRDQEHVSYLVPVYELRRVLNKF